VRRADARRAIRRDRAAVRSEWRNRCAFRPTRAGTVRAGSPDYAVSHARDREDFHVPGCRAPTSCSLASDLSHGCPDSDSNRLVRRPEFRIQSRERVWERFGTILKQIQGRGFIRLSPKATAADRGDRKGQGRERRYFHLALEADASAGSGPRWPLHRLKPRPPVDSSLEFGIAGCSDRAPGRSYLFILKFPTFDLVAA
jgi:hypothetical protein